jgi:Spy/CpxP family protein refolding chaperone
MFAWWNHVRRSSACGGGGCGPRGAHGGGEEHASAFPDWDGGEGGGGGPFGGPFGVRRPLRFLANKLGLSEKQVDDLAKVLSDLKTERAQVAVDQRRTTSAFADAIAEDTFDAVKVEAIAGERVKSQERLRGALVSALQRIHALLTPEQRGRLAYLLRTGALLL